MPMFAFRRRSRQDVVATVFEIQGVSLALPANAVVARSVWSGGGKPVITESLATGYTSFEDNLVLVFDLSRALGLPERESGSEEVIVIKTGQGRVAIQIDRFIGSRDDAGNAKLLSPDDILSLLGLTPVSNPV